MHVYTHSTVYGTAEWNLSNNFYVLGEYIHDWPHQFLRNFLFPLHPSVAFNFFLRQPSRASSEFPAQSYNTECTVAFDLSSEEELEMIP